MKPILPGIHHVTAITADPQANLEFYSGTLGLRLVKVTVNFDDPGSYHLYYGDRVGTPGTIMTFFSGGFRGRSGSGEVSATSFAVPAGSLEFWKQRLGASEGLRFGEPVLRFRDPDGMALEIVEAGPSGGTDILGLYGVTLALSSSERTAELLTGDMGFCFVGKDGERARYAAAGEFAAHVDLIVDASSPSSRMGAGVVHHVAFRTPDDAHQEAWLAQLSGRGYRVSPVMDRNYFHSIYFREPGGVLFEIATDPPGFTADQPLEELGTRLVLPSWLEPHRVTLEKALPPLKLPGVLAG